MVTYFGPKLNARITCVTSSLLESVSNALNGFKTKFKY